MLLSPGATSSVLGMELARPFAWMPSSGRPSGMPLVVAGGADGGNPVVGDGEDVGHDTDEGTAVPGSGRDRLGRNVLTCRCERQRVVGANFGWRSSVVVRRRRCVPSLRTV